MRINWYIKRKIIELKGFYLNVVHSFAFQLLLLNIKENILLTAFWGLMFLFVSGRFASNYGVIYVFLDPEYLNKVNFWSFFIVGAAFGMFTIAWHISSYMLNSRFFPFLASMNRPLNKYIINNSIIPIAFFTYYIIKIIFFQIENEFQVKYGVFLCIIGFVIGFILVFALINMYFSGTIKKVDNFLDKVKIPVLSRQQNDVLGKKIITYDELNLRETKWNVKNYINELLEVKPVRSVSHYNAALILQVFRQHHIHAFFLQLLGLILILIMGLFINVKYFILPAVASGLILFSLIVALIGAVRFWFKGWEIFGLTCLFLVLNTAMQKGYTSHKSKAIGMNYKKGNTNYDYNELHKILENKNLKKDKENTILILENWLNKNKKSNENPPIIFVNVSGGGLRSALWTTRVFEKCDSITNGQFFKNVALITGASGGMIGASYYREMYLQSIINNKKMNYKNINYNIAKDLTNPIIYAISVNDYYPFQTFKQNETLHFKDRGFIFEKTLNQNTFNAFTKKISDYAYVEKKAIIPMMIYAPTIINDGRKLFISPHRLSYLMKASNSQKMRYKQSDIDGIDFMRFFEKNKPDSLQYATAVRMSATYPFILPSIYLPSNPELQVMDAGIRDNQGYETSIRFIRTFKQWIKQNTRKVIFIEIRDTEKIKKPVKEPDFGIFQMIFYPLSGLLTTWLNVSDYNADYEMADMYDTFDNKVEVLRFEYIPEKKEKEASMSFHLAEREKKDILNTIYNSSNEQNLKILQQIIR
jgi:hypothetical protein